MTESGDPGSGRTPRVATILLAAGRSSRMGDAHKLLEVIEGRTVLEWALDAAIRADLGPVVAVTGHRGDDLAALVPDAVLTVHNPSWAEWMASSLQAGVSALSGRADAVAIALADMPAIRPADYRVVAEAWSPGRITLPTHRGRRGHPVLWSASLIGEFDELSGDSGARELLTRHADLVDEVPGRTGPGSSACR